MNRPRQHTPHGLRRLSLGCGGDMGVGVQGKSSGIVTQHTRDGLDVQSMRLRNFPALGWSVFRGKMDFGFPGS